MKKILITGAEGFIGSHLTELLINSDYEVRALVQYNSMNSWGWLDTIKNKKSIDVVLGDVRDPNHCREFTKDIDIIFHLAALIAIPYSYHAPYQYIDTNINGTLNLCEAAKENNIEKFVHVSTSEVYGTAKYIPIDELHPLQPQSPYSASKISADAIAMSYHYTYNLPISIARPFNTYGPRQSARAIIPTIITQILNKEEKLILGDLNPTRDFNFVTDTCEGLKLIMECSGALGKEINIGSNSEISIGELVNKIKKLMKSDIIIEQENKRFRPKGSEVFQLKCDNRLLKNLTKFDSQTSIDEGLKQTIKWYENKENIKMYRANTYAI